MLADRRWGYTGIKFPFQFDGRGRVRSSTVDLMEGDTSHIDEALEQLFRTIPGERWFRPDFGARPPELLFRPNHPSQLAQFAFIMRRILAKWEPRVEIIRFEPQMPTGAESEAGLAQTVVAYRILGTALTNSQIINERGEAVKVALGTD